MKSAQRVLWPALLILVLTMSGCPDAEFIPSNSGDFVLQSVVNGGSGRYEMATFSIDPLTMQPVDPQAAQALGFPVRTSGSFVTVDLAAPTTMMATTRVTGGRYQIDQISIRAFRLTDTTLPLPPAVKCVEAFSTLNGRPFVLTFDPPFEFTIPSDGGVRTLSITFDGPGLIGLFEDEGWPFCSQFSAGPFVTPANADLLQFITLEAQ